MEINKNIAYRPENADHGAGDLYNPQSETMILAIHGGGWSGLSKEVFLRLAGFLAENGYGVFNINYRLSSMAPWPACGNDCLAAANYLLADYQRIFILGSSAGGHLALMTGLRLQPERIAGIIAISAIGDLAPDKEINPGRYVALFHGEPTPEQLSEACPVNYLNENHPPILYTHFVHDQVVPLKSAENFVKAVGNVETYFYDLGAWLMKGTQSGCREPTPESCTRISKKKFWRFFRSVYGYSLLLDAMDKHDVF